MTVEYLIDFELGPPCTAVRAIVLLVFFGQDRQSEAKHMKPFVTCVARDPILTSAKVALEADVFIASIVVTQIASLILRHLQVCRSLKGCGSLTYGGAGNTTLLLISSLTIKS